MLRFLLRRLVMLVMTLFVSSFAIYSAIYLAPGNPIATLTGGRTPSPEAIEVLEARYHLNDPFLVRYFNWLGNAFTGDLGVSIPLRQDVSTLISQRIGTTIQLVMYAGLIIVIAGIGLGILGGLKRGIVDGGVIVLTTIGAAIPSFVAAIVLLSVFAVNLGWFPALGGGDGFLDQIWHLTLPAFALAFSSVALVARVTRTSVREELRREHVQTATSRGIPTSLIIRRHVLRNAAIPITTVVGITIASLFAASAIVERAFSLNGIGAYLIQAAASKDMAVVQGITLVIVTVFVVINTIVDVLYAVLDPRVSLGDPIPMSSIELTSAPPARRHLALPGLRGTGIVGHVCAGIVFVAAVVAVIGPSIALYDPNATNLSNSFVGPTGDHYLGFDSQGRDLLSRILTGARSSLVGPAVVVILAIIVGTALAVAAAWRGGTFDNIVSSALDVLFAFPAIVLAIMASVVWGAGLTSATIALAIAYTPYIARILRGAALRERAREYVAALEVQGLRATVICVRHIARNLLPLIAAQGAILFGYAIVDLAAISFIGLGVQPPQAEWGVMVANGQSGVLQGYPMESLSAGLCIVIVVVAVNLLGERLTDRADDVAR